MEVIAIIPARMGSTRFPGKPLANILGLPMVEHVRRRVALSPVFSQVLVATCDKEIFDAISREGGEVVMTADTHERCTDRVAEAALSIKADVIVNVQGDEPLVRPEVFEPLVAELREEPELVCSNLMSEIRDESEFINPNVVKTVFDLSRNAIYFSRLPIPHAVNSDDYHSKGYRQLGIIAFRSDFLQKFTVLPPTPLEQAESVDMLRAVEHGYKVRMVKTRAQMLGVDTPDDLNRAIAMMENDDLLDSYL